MVEFILSWYLHIYTLNIDIKIWIFMSISTWYDFTKALHAS